MGFLTQISILMLFFVVKVLGQDYEDDYHEYEEEYEEESPVVHLPTFSFMRIAEYGEIYHAYSYECASECFCPSTIPFAMYCDNRKLKVIPYIPAHIRFLYLQFNEIEAVTSKSFVNATGLREINLSYNKIRSSQIDRGVFAKLNNLKALHLQYNKLEEFPSPLPKSLERLILGFNKISKIPGDALANLVNVTMLDLCNNELTDSAFKGRVLGKMKRLMQINLCSNKLKAMPSDLPTSLLYLSLENNSISSIPEGYFTKTPKLTALRMSHNILQEVPYNVFNLSSLIELNLGNNRLTRIFYVSRSLEHLYLQNNDFESMNITLMCPTINPINPNQLTYLRIDQNKLKGPLSTYAYLCFPRIQSIYYGEQKKVQTEVTVTEVYTIHEVAVFPEEE
uniref:Osteomodulin n=2 Tax=Latimeria chalumnae TaxID=7897 RepID=H3BHW5_LATCH